MKKTILIPIFVILLISTSFALILLPIDIKKGETLDLKKENKVAFEYKGYDYQITVEEVEEEFVKLVVEPTNVKTNLMVNDIRAVDIDKDTINDIIIALTYIEDGKATLTFKIIPAVEEEIPKEIVPEKPPTEEEQKQTSEAADKFLQAAPNIELGLGIISGNYRIFDAAKKIVLGKAVEKMSPEGQQAHQVLEAVKAIATSVGIGKTQKPAGAAAAVLELRPDVLLAAWDGKNFYYNFGLKDIMNKDLSFLFKKGKVFANNVYVYKDFDEESLRFEFIGSSLDVNDDLFINLEGYVDLAEKNALITEASVKSVEENNKLEFNSVASNPFSALFSNKGKLIYNAAEINKIKANLVEIEMIGKDWKILFDKIKASVLNSDVKTEISPYATSLFETKKTIEGNEIEALLNRKTLVPSLAFIKLKPYNWAFSLIGSGVDITPESNVKLNLIGGKINAEFLTDKEEKIIFDNKEKLTYEKEFGNKVTTADLSEMTKDNLDFIKIAPFKIKEKVDSILEENRERIV